MSPDLLLFGASEKVLAGDVLFFGILFVLSLVAGRLFCGWICPAGSLQDYGCEINKKPNRNQLNWIKMIFFVPWILFFLLLVIFSGGVNHVDIFYKRAFGVSIAGATEWTMYFMTVAIVLLLMLFTGKRGFCHFLCWISPFMIVGGKVRDKLHFPSLRIFTKPELCNACGSCSHVCPMSLPVSELMKKGDIIHAECTLCLSCVDICPKDAIKLGFGYSQVKK